MLLKIDLAFSFLCIPLLVVFLSHWNASVVLDEAPTKGMPCNEIITLIYLEI